MLKLIMKIEQDKNWMIKITTKNSERRYGNGYLDETIETELKVLNFDEKERKITCSLSALKTLIEKDFNLILYEKDLSYGLNIYMNPKGKGKVLLTSIGAPKQCGVAKVFDNAEMWASDLIRQFNTDRENTL